MKLKALFNKRNYKHLYHQILPFPKHLRNEKLYNDFTSLNSIIEYLEVKKYDRIVVVASGPSAIKLKKRSKYLYFCCNDAIKLMDDINFVYMLHDPYYLMKYLKTFKEKQNWKSTIYWFYYSDRSKYIYDIIQNYLAKYSRERHEFLLTNHENNFGNSKIYTEINKVLMSIFNYRPYGVNSGFNTLVFASVIAYLAEKPLDIFGLDAGVGGEKYFNRTSTLGLNIKKENTKMKIAEFLEALEKSEIKVQNYSNFKGKNYSEILK